MIPKGKIDRRTFAAIVFTVLVIVHVIALAACFVVFDGPDDGENLSLWSSFLAVNLSFLTLIAALLYIRSDPAPDDATIEYLERKRAEEGSEGRSGTRERE